MTNVFNKQKIVSDQNIKELVLYLLSGIHEILDQNLVGLYLFGSLAYGDFKPDSSDIDLVAIVVKPLNLHDLEQIKLLHKKAGELYEKWSHRLECSYVPIQLLKNISPPKEPRPYYGNGIFYDEAPYGNEWIINNYLLFEHGIPLLGPDFKELTSPIAIIEVQKACIRDLFQEWEPKISDDAWLNNSHYQSYLVMNLCRILYTVICGTMGTKKISAKWVKEKFNTPWINHLIDVAETWNYDKKMSLNSQTINFIKFTIDQIKQTTLYQKMYSLGFVGGKEDEYRFSQ